MLEDLVRAGRHLMVVYENVDAITVYPVTAYEAPRGTNDDPSADHPQSSPRS